MGKQAKRSGKKFAQGHTSATKSVAILADKLVQSGLVKKISLGYIRSGLRPLHGRKRLKIKSDKGSLLIALREGITVQEIRVFGDDLTTLYANILLFTGELGFENEGSELSPGS